MWIVVYRPHNRLHCETQYIGPFASHDAAYDHLCSIPGLGTYRPDGQLNNPGVKFVECLLPKAIIAPQEFSGPHHAPVLSGVYVPKAYAARARYHRPSDFPCSLYGFNKVLDSIA